MKRSVARITIILSLAFLARLLFASLVVGLGSDPRGDERDYHVLATNVAAGDGYTLADGKATARRPPLHPLFLAIFYRLFGPDLRIARLLQVILGTLVVWLTYIIASRALSPRAGWIAALFCALDPYLIFMSSYVLTENLYVVLLLLLVSLWMGFSLPQAPLSRALWAGLILGLSLLCRPPALLLGVFIALSILLRYHGPSRRPVTVFMVLLGVSVVLFPWSLRNKIIFDRWIPFTTHGGITFYQGNNRAVVDIPQYRGGVAPFYSLPGREKLIGLDEISENREAWRLGKEFLSENRAEIPHLLWWRFARFWRFKSEAGMSGIKSGWWWNKETFFGQLATSLDLGLIFALVTIPLFILGLVLTRDRWRGLLLLYGVVIVHTMVALVFFGSLRGRIPVEPVMAVFAGASLSRILEHISGNDSVLLAARKEGDQD